MITLRSSRALLLSCMFAFLPLQLATARSFTSASFTIQSKDGGSFTTSPASISVELGGTVTVTNATDTSEYVSPSTPGICNGNCTQLIKPGGRATFVIPLDGKTGQGSLYCAPKACGSIAITLLPKSKMSVDQSSKATGGSIEEHIDPDHPAAGEAPEGSEHLHNGAPLPKSGPAQTLGGIIALSLAGFFVFYIFAVKGARLG